MERNLEGDSGSAALKKIGKEKKNRNDSALFKYVGKDSSGKTFIYYV